MGLTLLALKGAEGVRIGDRTSISMGMSHVHNRNNNPP